MGSFPPPNIVDFVALIFIVIGAFIGYRRGLSGELAQLISMAAAFVLSLFLYHPLGSWLHENTQLYDRPQLARALAYFATIVVATIAMVLLRFLLKRIMQVVIEREADKIGGVIAGLVRSIILVAIVLLLMNMWPHQYLNRLFGEESMLGTVVVRCMPSLHERVGSVDEIRQKVKDRFQEVDE